MPSNGQQELRGLNGGRSGLSQQQLREGSRVVASAMECERLVGEPGDKQKTQRLKEACLEMFATWEGLQKGFGLDISVRQYVSPALRIYMGPDDLSPLNDDADWVVYMPIATLNKYIRFSDQHCRSQSERCVTVLSYVLAHELGHLAMPGPSVALNLEREMMADTKALYYMLTAGLPVGVLSRAESLELLAELLEGEEPPGRCAQCVKAPDDSSCPTPCSLRIVELRNGLGNLLQTAVRASLAGFLLHFAQGSVRQGHELLALAERVSMWSPDDSLARRLVVAPETQLYLQILTALDQPGSLVKLGDDGQNNALSCRLIPPSNEGRGVAQQVGSQPFRNLGFATATDTALRRDETQRLQEAIQYAQEYLDFTPGVLLDNANIVVGAIRLYNNLGCAMMRLGEFESAKAALLKGIKLAGRAPSDGVVEYIKTILRENFGIANWMSHADITLRQAKPPQEESNALIAFLSLKCREKLPEACENCLYVQTMSGSGQGLCEREEMPGAGLLPGQASANESELSAGEEKTRGEAAGLCSALGNTPLVAGGTSLWSSGNAVLLGETPLMLPLAGSSRMTLSAWSAQEREGQSIRFYVKIDDVGMGTDIKYTMLIRTASIPAYARELERGQWVGYGAGGSGLYVVDCGSALHLLTVVSGADSQGEQRITQVGTLLSVESPALSNRSRQ